MSTRSNVALIFGISGQDGAYLSQFLLKHGYEVHGTSRSGATGNLKALGIDQNVALHVMPTADLHAVTQIISNIRPGEIYNLAAQSSVGLSFQYPYEAISSAVVGTLNILESIRSSGLKARMFSASSGECFGDTGPLGADEQTPFQPISPYAVGKVAAHWLVTNYRKSYDLFACSGILFNHESPLRPPSFVAQKIVRGAIDIFQQKSEVIRLGDTDVSRDWGWAPEYVEAMWLMLQRDDPRDYIIATGQAHQLKEFVATVFEHLGLDWRQHIQIDGTLSRPNDARINFGRPQRAKIDLNWTAATSMKQVALNMVGTELLRRRACG